MAAWHASNSVRYSLPVGGNRSFRSRCRHSPSERPAINSPTARSRALRLSGVTSLVTVPISLPTLVTCCATYRIKPSLLELRQWSNMQYVAYRQARQVQYRHTRQRACQDLRRLNLEAL